MMKQKRLLGLMLLSVIPMLDVGLAGATSATLGQKILPLDCVFETVNDGTGTIHYVTPAACGQVINNSGEDTGNHSTDPSAGAGDTTDDSQIQPTGQYNPRRNVFFVPSISDADNTATSTNTKQLPWRPIASATAASDTATDKSTATAKSTTGKKVATAATAIGVVALIALAVFIF